MGSPVVRTTQQPGFPPVYPMSMKTCLKGMNLSGETLPIPYVTLVFLITYHGTNILFTIRQIQTWLIAPFKRPERDEPDNEIFNNHVSMVRI